jgi:hypothetical protein
MCFQSVWQLVAVRMCSTACTTSSGAPRPASTWQALPTTEYSPHLCSDWARSTRLFIRSQQRQHHQHHVCMRDADASPARLRLKLRCWSSGVSNHQPSRQHTTTTAAIRLVGARPMSSHNAHHTYAMQCSSAKDLLEVESKCWLMRCMLLAAEQPASNICHADCHTHTPIYTQTVVCS